MRWKLELLGVVVAGILLLWTQLTLAKVRTDLANQKVATRTEQLRHQAADVSYKSCQFALGQVQVATGALVQATRFAYAATDLALQRASSRAQVTAQRTTQLLTVRPAAGQDCETAAGLARSAWFEGQ